MRRRHRPRLAAALAAAVLGAASGEDGSPPLAWSDPPAGTKSFALDVALGDRGALGKGELEAAMQGHVLAQAELVGTYERKR